MHSSSITAVGRTIAALLTRLYDPTAGRVLLDGVDLRELDPSWLRRQVGIVSQEPVLFSSSIADNIRFGRPEATDAEVRQAARLAHAAEFIEALPGGYDTLVGERGVTLSGGQKQRLSIARAMVKKPPVYILDDSFSALDFKTDAALRRALKAQAANSTLIIVTQRVSTVKNAEQIIVLDEGRIVGKGTHQELMKTCDTYKEIALSQLSMEE